MLTYAADSIAVLSQDEITFLVNEYKDGMDITQEEVKQNPALNGLYARALSARNRIIEHNIKLVRDIAKKYKGRGIEVDDLEQEGILGIIHALKKYDPERTRFSTYASYWIRCYIRCAIDNQSRTIRIPVKTFQHMRKYNKIRDEIIHLENRIPESQEILDRMNISNKRKRKLEFILAAEKNVGSLQTTNEEEENIFDDRLIDTKAVEPISLKIHQEEKDILNKIIKTLPEKQRAVLLMRKEGQTFREIGEKLGISRQRVEQIEKAVINRYKQVA